MTDYVLVVVTSLGIGFYLVMYVIGKIMGLYFRDDDDGE